MRDFRLQHAGRSLPALLLLLIVACGGVHFTASPVGPENAGSGGESAETGGTANLGGESNSDAGSAGAGAEEMGESGGPPSAGSGGKGPVGCASCGLKEYCQDVVNKCRSCADFSRLEFAEPQALSLSHTSNSSERFPRTANSGSALFYTVGAADSRRLWYTTAPTSGIGSAISDPGTDSGPLLAAGFAEENLFFDREKSTKGQRKIMMASWSAGTLSDPTDVLSPINSDDSSDYSFAAAPNVGHAYWMSTRSGTPQLFWESIKETPLLAPRALPLKIRIGNTADCERLGNDATPWVNLTGTLLLFSAESMADTCEPNDSNAHDLFAVPLAKDGVPASAAIPLSALNTTGGGSDETDPSLAPDACSIYFASDNGTGNYDLYRAARH